VPSAAGRTPYPRPKAIQKPLAHRRIGDEAGAAAISGDVTVPPDAPTHPSWTKWDGRWRFEVGEDCFLHPGGRGRALVFAVTPDKVLAFGKGKFTQTSHRF
jgi:hypothetical protein